MLVATHNLAAIPIEGDGPIQTEARNAIAMLKTTVVQQANYSHRQHRLHSTPHQSRTRSQCPELPAVSSSAHRRRAAQPLAEQHQPRIPQDIVDIARVLRVWEEENTRAGHNPPAHVNTPARVNPTPNVNPLDVHHPPDATQTDGRLGDSSSRMIRTPCLVPAL